MGFPQGYIKYLFFEGPQAAVEATLKAKTLSVDLDGFKGMSPGNELDKCIGDLRKKVTEDRHCLALKSCT